MDLPLGAVADVAAKALDLVDVRERRNNTDEMQAAAKAEERQKLRDRINAAIAAGDLDELRKLAAEV